MNEVISEKGKIIGENKNFFKVQILSGEDKGKIIHTSTDQRLEVKKKNYKVGDNISIYVQKNLNGGKDYSIEDFWHLDALFIWIILFFMTFLLFGKKQGLKSIISLLGSIILIFFVFIPLILKGFDPVISTLFISFFITIFTIFLIIGNSKKSIVAILGTFFGVLFAYLFSYIISITTKLDGFGSEEARMFAINFGDKFDISGIFLSGIIIGALGAVMDVAISISSGLHEIKQHKKDISFSELYKSGMNIGGDIMGGMVNTLVFAYIGTSVIIILMTSMNNIPLMEFLNYGFISEEILRTLAGSIGLILSIPITAFFAGIFFRGDSKKSTP